jgi:hypothetical protein
MKVFLVGCATVLICMLFQIFQADYNLHQLHIFELKYQAETAAKAAAQYYVHSKYADGIYQFNQVEGIKAAEYTIKHNLNLNDDFTQKTGNYWQDAVTYTIQFFDDVNTTYPYIFTDSESLFTYTIAHPTIVISINCGKARYRVPYISLIPTSRRIAAHEWKGK